MVFTNMGQIRESPARRACYIHIVLSGTILDVRDAYRARNNPLNAWIVCEYTIIFYSNYDDYRCMVRGGETQPRTSVYIFGQSILCSVDYTYILNTLRVSIWCARLWLFVLGCRRVKRIELPCSFFQSEFYSPNELGIVLINFGVLGWICCVYIAFVSEFNSRFRVTCDNTLYCMLCL